MLHRSVVYSGPSSPWIVNLFFIDSSSLHLFISSSLHQLKDQIEDSKGFHENSIQKQWHEMNSAKVNLFPSKASSASFFVFFLVKRLKDVLRSLCILLVLLVPWYPVYYLYYLCHGVLSVNFSELQWISMKGMGNLFARIQHPRVVGISVRRILVCQPRISSWRRSFRRSIP